MPVKLCYSGHMMTQSEDVPAWLSRTEAAVYAGVDLSTIDRRLRTGELTRFRQGKRRVRIYREELDELFKPRKEEEEPNNDD